MSVMKRMSTARLSTRSGDHSHEVSRKMSENGSSNIVHACARARQLERRAGRGRGSPHHEEQVDEVPRDAEGRLGVDQELISPAGGSRLTAHAAGMPCGRVRGKC